MSSSINGLQLYDYMGRYRNAQSINTQRPLRIPQTEFGPGFEWNGASNNVQNNPKLQNLGVDISGRLIQAPEPSYQSAMSYGTNTYNRPTNQTYQGGISGFEDYVASLSITDQHYSDLMQQGRFSIYNGRVGVQVETDGIDTITGVSLDPNNKAQRNGAVGNIEFPDRTLITERAASRQGNTLPPLDPAGQLNGLNLNNRIFRFNKPGVPPAENQSLLELLEGLKKTNPFQVPQVRPSTETSTENPLLQKLLRLQPIEVQTPIFGPDSQLSAEHARNIGTVKASYGVELSDDAKSKILAIRERLAQENQVIPPQRVLRARDGMMPINPFLQQPDAFSQQSVSFGGSTSSQMQLETSTNAADRKSSGGYIPFHLGSGTSTSGEQPSDTNRRRRPLNFVA